MDMKTCSKCKIEKPREEFGARKDARDGLKSNCRECANASVARWEAENKEKKKAQMAEWYVNNSDHSKNYSKEYYQKNKEVKLEKCKNWHKNNPDKVAVKHKKWASKNKEHLKNYNHSYAQENPEKITAKEAKRRAAKLQATPKWLTEEDFAKIREVYKEAKRLEKLDGIKRHVDHYYPLQGKTVCGLHIYENLQILTESENCSKNNKLPTE
jgi:hypothetical protein